MNETPFYKIEEAKRLESVVSEIRAEQKKTTMMVTDIWHIFKPEFGQPGLMAEMQEVRKELKEVEEHIEHVEQKQNKYFWMATAVASTIATIFSAVGFLIKILKVAA